MANVQDFIKTYMDVNQLLLQREQVALAQENARIARIGAVQAIGQQLYNRGAIGDLSALAGDTGGQGFDLRSILEGSAPAAGVTQRGLEGEGLQAATPEERSRLAAESLTRGATGGGRYQLNTEDFLNHLLQDYNPTTEMRQRLAAGLASKTATGMGEGQLAVSSALAGLPQPEITEAAGIDAGTRASAGDVLSATTQAAGIRAQETGQALQYKIAELNAQVDLRQSQIGADAKIGEWRDPGKLSDRIEQLSKTLAENPNLPSQTVDFYQRQILANILAMKGSPLDPYRDINTPEELANWMKMFTGTSMNPRTISGIITNYIPGGN